MPNYRPNSSTSSSNSISSSSTCVVVIIIACARTNHLSVQFTLTHQNTVNEKDNITQKNTLKQNCKMYVYHYQKGKKCIIHIVVAPTRWGDDISIKTHKTKTGMLKCVITFPFTSTNSIPSHLSRNYCG